MHYVLQHRESIIIAKFHLLRNRLLAGIETSSCCELMPGWTQPPGIISCEKWTGAILKVKSAKVTALSRDPKKTGKYMWRCLVSIYLVYVKKCLALMKPIIEAAFSWPYSLFFKHNYPLDYCAFCHVVLVLSPSFEWHVANKAKLSCNFGLFRPSHFRRGTGESYYSLENVHIIGPRETCEPLDKMI